MLLSPLKLSNISFVRAEVHTHSIFMKGKRVKSVQLVTLQGVVDISGLISGSEKWQVTGVSGNLMRMLLLGK